MRARWQCCWVSVTTKRCACWRNLKAMNLNLNLPRIDTGSFHFRTRPKLSKSVPAFDKWLTQVTPTYSWEWPHLQHIREQLDQVTEGITRRLMISVPPQHGK